MIVIIGKSGYISSAYQAFFTRQNIPYHCLSHHEIHPMDPYTAKILIRDLKPSFLINAAGYTGKPNVDACEIQRDECIQANLVLPMTLKSICADMKLPWGHISSGCIYEGDGPDGKGFSEEDTPNFSFRQQNCSFYSGLKALTESLLHDDVRCYLWRLRMPFNGTPAPRNLLTKFLTYAKLVDARNSISHLDEFVEATWQCLEKQLPFGIYNVTNPGSITTREICGMMTNLGLGPKEFHFFESVEAFQKTVPSPRSHCVLDTGKLQRAGINMRPIHEAVLSSLQIMQKGLPGSK